MISATGTRFRSSRHLTEEFLTGELILPFGPEQVVLEVLETVTIDAQIIAGITGLVEAGYRIALDDFVRAPGTKNCSGSPRT